MVARLVDSELPRLLSESDPTATRRRLTGGGAGVAGILSGERKLTGG